MPSLAMLAGSLPAWQISLALSPWAEALQKLLWEPYRSALQRTALLRMRLAFAEELLRRLRPKQCGRVPQRADTVYMLVGLAA
mmetsp:Transcript_62659/g.111328  ORF Transcript_62659/g.111328 Transcript_62659/m.111328 type:complete len:83 (-) Transcript_62659:42-290(-)